MAINSITNSVAAQQASTYTAAKTDYTKKKSESSTKTDTGTLESKAGWKGLCRKCMTLIFVLVAYRIDLILGLDYIRNAVIIAFITNELISLVENAGLMGVPLPAVITKAIDILQKKSESEVKKNE